MISRTHTLAGSVVAIALVAGCGAKNPADSPAGKSSGKCVVETTSHRHEVTITGEFVLAFDAGGHLTRMDVKSGSTPPETLSITSTYDAAGHKTSETRVVNEADSAQKESWSWSYENGRIARSEVTIEITGGPEKGARDVDSVTATKRDSAGRPIRLERVLRSIPGDEQRAAGETESTVREVVERVYGEDGRVAREDTKKVDADKVTTSSGLRFEYDKAGHIVLSSFSEGEGEDGKSGHGLVKRSKFDGAGRLVRAEVTQKVGGEESSSVEEFAYDDAGRLSSSHDDEDEKTFRYTGNCTPDLWDLFKAPEIYWTDPAEAKK